MKTFLSSSVGNPSANPFHDSISLVSTSSYGKRLITRLGLVHFLKKKAIVREGLYPRYLVFLNNVSKNSRRILLLDLFYFYPFIKPRIKPGINPIVPPPCVS